MTGVASLVVPLPHEEHREEGADERDEEPEGDHDARSRAASKRSTSWGEQVAVKVSVWRHGPIGAGGSPP